MHGKVAYQFLPRIEQVFMTTASELTSWTLCVVSLPSRHNYLRKLLASVSDYIKRGLIVRILYNANQNAEMLSNIVNLRKDFAEVEFQFYASETYGISEARNRLLAQVVTKYVAFVDDDCSFRTLDVFYLLANILRKNSLGLVGLPSFASDTGETFKPRKETPRMAADGLLYMPVEGMFAAAYTQLLKDVGGFNERKRFFMEWTDLNTRLHRFGHPTAISMKSGNLIHWLDAPDSATRSRLDRSEDITYGLLSTIIEFDWDVTTNGAENPEIINNVYYKYIYSDGTHYSDFLLDVAKVVPRLSADLSKILAYREELRKLPFQFKPKVKLEEKDWYDLISFSQKAMEKYR